MKRKPRVKHRKSRGVRRVKPRLHHKKKYKHGVHQIGKSVRRLDAQRRAKPPGKRKSKRNKRYYENRKNRSDMPGKWV